MTTMAWSLPQMLKALPLVARRKHAALTDQVDNWRALIKANLARDQDREHELMMLKNRAATCHPDDRPAVEEEIALVTDELDKLSRDRAKLNSMRANGEQVLAQINNFIPLWYGSQLPAHLQPKGKLRPVHVMPQRRDGESVADAIVRVRSEIMGLKAELAQVQAAPLPRKELLAKAKAHVAELARQGAPMIDTASGSFTVNWDALSVPPHWNSSPDVLMRKLALMFPDKVYEMLAAKIADAPGVPAAERERRIRELESEILQLQHTEEALVEQAIESGLEVHRNPYASPWALLGLTDEPLGVMAVAAE